jgi:transcriptional regulator GlxA family with amidase domain
MKAIVQSHMPPSMLFSLTLLITLPVPVLSQDNAGHKEKAPTRKSVGILLFHNVEALDFCGPYEVFSSASANNSALFDVHLVAATLNPVAARGTLKVVPTHTYETCPKLDILVVPGTGDMSVLKNEALVAWVGKQAAAVELATSVCTGSLILAKAGLLDGKQATTHHSATAMFGAMFPKVKVISNRRVVEDGKFVTAAGVSSGIDMALDVVAKLHGAPTAERTARIIEYPYSTTKNDQK